jgi:hypothetical protein
VNRDTTPSTPIRCRDFDESTRRLRQSPQRRGASVAQQCSVPASKNGCHPTALSTHPPGTNRVDALVQTAELPPLHSALHSANAHPRGEQLLASDHAMLAR